jgi:hypothetical protein
MEVPESPNQYQVDSPLNGPSPALSTETGVLLVAAGAELLVEVEEVDVVTPARDVEEVTPVCFVVVSEVLSIREVVIETEDELVVVSIGSTVALVSASDVVLVVTSGMVALLLVSVSASLVIVSRDVLVLLPSGGKWVLVGSVDELLVVVVGEPLLPVSTGTEMLVVPAVITLVLVSTSTAEVEVSSP